MLTFCLEPNIIFFTTTLIHGYILKFSLPKSRHKFAKSNHITQCNNLIQCSHSHTHHSYIACLNTASLPTCWGIQKHRFHCDCPHLTPPPQQKEPGSNHEAALFNRDKVIISDCQDNCSNCSCNKRGFEARCIHADKDEV